MEPLSQYIRDNNLTQTVVARTLGISDATLSNILKGKRKPGYALATKIESLMGIPRGLIRPDIFGDAA